MFCCFGAWPPPQSLRVEVLASHAITATHCISVSPPLFLLHLGLARRSVGVRRLESDGPEQAPITHTPPAAQRVAPQPSPKTWPSVLCTSITHTSGTAKPLAQTHPRWVDGWRLGGWVGGWRPGGWVARWRPGGWVGGWRPGGWVAPGWWVGGWRPAAGWVLAFWLFGPIGLKPECAQKSSFSAFWLFAPNWAQARMRPKTFVFGIPVVQIKLGWSPNVPKNIGIRHSGSSNQIGLKPECAQKHPFSTSWLLGPN